MPGDPFEAAAAEIAREFEIPAPQPVEPTPAVVPELPETPGPTQTHHDIPYLNEFVAGHNWFVEPEVQQRVVGAFWDAHGYDMPEPSNTALSILKGKLEEAGDDWRILVAPMLTAEERVRLGTQQPFLFTGSSLSRDQREGREALVMPGRGTYGNLVDGTSADPSLRLLHRVPDPTAPGRTIFVDRAQYAQILERTGWAVRAGGRLWVASLVDVSPGLQLPPQEARHATENPTQPDRQKEWVTGKFFDRTVRVPDTIETRLAWTLMADANRTPVVVGAIVLGNEVLFKTNNGGRMDETLVGYGGLRRTVSGRYDPQLKLAYYEPGTSFQVPIESRSGIPGSKDS